MKRKPTRKADVEKLYAKIAPQIVLRSEAATGIVMRVNPSEFELVKTPGSLTLGDSPELHAAFEAVVEGARSGLGKIICCPICKNFETRRVKPFQHKRVISI
jgi:hypothetical protein